MDELTNSPSRRHGMIADNLLRFYRDEAKGRQMRKPVSVPVKLPEQKNSDAREAAGKAAGVNHTYVDKASDPEALADFREAMKGQGKRNDIPNILYNIKEVQAGTGKAYTLSRLKRETPELFERVKAGDPQRRSALIGWRWVRRCLRRDTGQRRAMAMALGRGLLYLETKGEATIAGLLPAGSAEQPPRRFERKNTLLHALCQRQNHPPTTTPNANG